MTPITEVECQGIIEIRDPEIDVAEIMRRIRQNMAGRERLPPLAAALGRARLAEERKRLSDAIHHVYAKTRNFGVVDTLRSGWKAKVELFIKKCMRKVIWRYLAQQQQVNEQIIATLNIFAHYLEQQDEVLRMRLDQAERLTRQRAIPPHDTAPPANQNRSRQSHAA